MGEEGGETGLVLGEDRNKCLAKKNCQIKDVGKETRERERMTENKRNGKKKYE